MSFQIDNEQCIDCRLCIPECPDGGISVDFGSAGEFGNTGTYVIDSNKCTECIEFNRESKCAYICPVDAIEVKIPESDKDLWEKWENNQKMK